MRPGDRVVAGIDPDSEAGVVLDVHGGRATVAWDSGARTVEAVDRLEPLTPPPSGLGQWRYLRNFHGLGGSAMPDLADLRAAAAMARVVAHQLESLHDAIEAGDDAAAHALRLQLETTGPLACEAIRQALGRGDG